MAGSLRTAVVGEAPGVIYGAPGSTQGITVLNLDTQNTIWVGYSASISAAVGGGGIPIAPGASMQFDGSASIYAVATASVVVAVGPGVTGYFLPASLANIGGSKVYVQAGTPTGTIPVNSVWFDTTNGSLQTWNGTAWVNQAFNAQELIQAATILGTQIAAQAVTAANVANGTLTTAQIASAAGILGTQIAAATVTGSNIAANTITAANIAANTITASQLAAGIVYAGIVNSTTINGGTLVISQGSGATYEQIEINGATGVTTWSKYQSPTVVIRQILADGTDLTYNDPGSGNPQGALLISASAHVGTALDGTNYGHGVFFWQPGTSAIGISAISGQPVLDMSAPNRTYATADAELYTETVNAGAVNEYVITVLTSGKESGNDDAAIQLFSESADATLPAKIVLEFGGTVAYEVTKTGPKYSTPPVYHAACSSNLSVTATNADVTGANINVVVAGSTSTVVITGVFDMQPDAAAAANIVGTLDWAGATQSAQAVMVSGAAVTNRATVSQTWVITGVTAGTYNAKLQATGTAGGTIRATHTSITAQVWEGI